MEAEAKANADLHVSLPNKSSEPSSSVGAKTEDSTEEMEAKAKADSVWLRPRTRMLFKAQPVFKDIPMKEVVYVKVKAPQSNIDGDDEEIKIPKVKAVCKFCFNVFEEDNVLKTKCGCDELTLAHEECATEWFAKTGSNKCHVCEQDIQNITVNLSSTPMISG